MNVLCIHRSFRPLQHIFESPVGFSPVFQFRRFQGSHRHPQNIFDRHFPAFASLFSCQFHLRHTRYRYVFAISPALPETVSVHNLRTSDPPRLFHKPHLALFLVHDNRMLAERAFYCLAQKGANFTNISASVKSALFFIPQRNACSVVCTQETVTLVQSSEGQMPI